MILDKCNSIKVKEVKTVLNEGNGKLSLLLDCEFDDGSKYGLTIPEIDLNSLKINLTNKDNTIVGEVSFKINAVNDEVMVMKDLS